MSIGNLKDSGNQGNNFPWQLKMLQGLQLIADAAATIDVDLTDILNELADQTALLQAIENNTDGIEGILTAIRNNFNTAFTGSFTPDAKSGGSLGFPYSLPDATYKAVTIIIPTGETLKMNGVTLPAGTYNFSGEGSQLCKPFTLSDPSTAGGANIVLLTVE